MTIAYMVANRAKRPVKSKVPHNPRLPIYWNKGEAKFAAEQIGRGARVIRVMINETLLTYSYLKRTVNK